MEQRQDTEMFQLVEEAIGLFEANGYFVAYSYMVSNSVPREVAYRVLLEPDKRRSKLLDDTVQQLLKGR